MFKLKKKYWAGPLLSCDLHMEVRNTCGHSFCHVLFVGILEWEVVRGESCVSQDWCDRKVNSRGKYVAEHIYYLILILFLKKLFIFFSARLLSVLRGHSFFSSPPQRPMTSDFEGFSISDFIHYIYFPILILEKEPVFSLFNVQC